MSGLHARLTGRLGALALDAGLVAEAGEVVALVGASGAGKSTVLRAIAGLERLEGEVRLGATVWQGAGRFVPAHRRPVGYVFQHGGLLPHLSVRGNLAYGRRRAGADAAALDEAITVLRLEPLLDRAPDRLSGGERQRVALARALSLRPGLLLLDEPLSGLDAPTKAELLPRLREAFARLAAPVVYVSHDAAEVRGLADRVLRLEGGAIRHADTRAEDHPLVGRSQAEVERLAVAAVRAGLDADADPVRT